MKEMKGRQAETSGRSGFRVLGELELRKRRLHWSCRDNTGVGQRTHHLEHRQLDQDLFMKLREKRRVVVAVRSKDVPERPDLWGQEFEDEYTWPKRAACSVASKLPARELYGRP